MSSQQLRANKQMLKSQCITTSKSCNASHHRNHPKLSHNNVTHHRHSQMMTRLTMTVGLILLLVMQSLTPSRLVMVITAATRVSSKSTLITISTRYLVKKSFMLKLRTGLMPAMPCLNTISLTSTHPNIDIIIHPMKVLTLQSDN